MDYADGCKLLGNYDIVQSEHRSYAIYVALEDYFNDKLCGWDNIHKVTLNPLQRSHREKCIEELEHQLDIYHIENNLSCMQISCINQELEQVDEIITRMLNNAAKKVEGMKRSMPHSKEKEKRRSMVLHCKMKLRELKGSVIDIELKDKRREKAEMQNAEITTIQEDDG